MFSVTRIELESTLRHFLSSSRSKSWPCKANFNLCQLPLTLRVLALERLFFLGVLFDDCLKASRCKRVHDTQSLKKTSGGLLKHIFSVNNSTTTTMSFWTRNEVDFSPTSSPPAAPIRKHFAVVLALGFDRWWLEVRSWKLETHLVCFHAPTSWNNVKEAKRKSYLTSDKIQDTEFWISQEVRWTKWASSADDYLDSGPSPLNENWDIFI